MLNSVIREEFNSVSKTKSISIGDFKTLVSGVSVNPEIDRCSFQQTKDASITDASIITSGLIPNVYFVKFKLEDASNQTFQEQRTI